MNEKYESIPERNGSTSSISVADIFWKGLSVLASLRITLVLLSLGIVLVFYGTLAQIDQGIWTVMDQYFRSWMVWIPMQLNAEFLKVFFDLPKDTQWKGHLPFPGGWFIGWAMVINLIAAHAIRFRFTWKRSGILLIHSGMLMLMFGEFFTGRFAVESTMVLQNGETASFIDDSRKFELAIRTPKDDKNQSVWVIPGSILLSETGKVISRDNLPVDVEVIECTKNSDARHMLIGQGKEGLISSEGGYYKIVPTGEESGVKSEREDAAAARVRVRKKGTDEVIGEFYLSLWHYRNYNRRLFFAQPQTFVVDGKEYRIELRNRRIDKSYSIQLHRFEHQVYLGTKKAKDFASTVQLRDPQAGEDRTVRVWMNNPLRYDGETFYQAGFIPDESGTVLQVVNNPVWQWPYYSCAIITIGMLIHFLLLLSGFLKKKLAVVARERQFKPATGLDHWFPWAVVGSVIIFLIWQAYPRSVQSRGMDLTDVGKMPVVEGGRVKPLDTVARTSLMTISNRSEFEDRSGKLQPAIVWLLDVISSPDEVSSPAADYKVFRIENDQVLNYLNLKMRPGSYRYSFNEIIGDDNQRSKLQREFQRLEEITDQKKFTLFDSKMAELSKKLNLYLSLVNRASPLVLPPDGKSDWSHIAHVDRIIGQELHDAFQEQATNEVLLRFFQSKKIDPRTLSEDDFKHVMGLMNNEQRAQLNQQIAARRQQIVRQETGRFREQVSPAAASYMRIMQSYQAGERENFNKAVAEYKEKFLQDVSKPDSFIDRILGTDKVRFEKFFNQFEPFYLCMWLFVVVFILGCISWLGWSDPLRRAAVLTMILTLGLQTFAILARMHIQGRPPVTNLYSSAVFIGWGAVGVSLLLESWYRNSIGIVAGAVNGFATMIVAHHLGTTGGDTLEMMEAVLDTNFWLATHVTCVTLGYTATFITGTLATVYILWGVFFNSLDDRRSRALSSMIYGMLCFATLLSFVGTVLGGIWADQSWGRFWGWDPKENGAVLIVLWNVLILHARWSGLVKQRGVAALAVVGNMITAWSWFGTNQLGVGLHAYGFSKELAAGCRYYWLAQLLIIGIALLPLKYWRSFSEETVLARAAEAKARLNQNRPPAGSARA